MLEDIMDVTAPTNLIGKAQAPVNRRDVLKMSLAGILAGVVPIFPTAARAGDFSAWRISFRHSHTGESFSGVYRIGDRYLPEAFERMNYILRDFRTGESFPMDPHVIDIASIIQAKTGHYQPLEVLSGYRSPKTNNMLRHASAGVASNSLHMYGQAMDIRMRGYRTGKLQVVAKNLKAGGVGYYPRSDFVHVDTGKVRFWQL